MAAVRFEQISKHYPGGHTAVRDLSLDIADGEFLVLVGPSGCGKSTALRIVAGLETPTTGRVFLGEREVTHVPPQERDIAMVFQSYALYPHLSVRENLAFGLRMRRVSKTERGARVERVAETLGLTALLDRKPAQLSGGQRQRVALGRAMVREPQVFLLDEPLSNLDVRLRIETRTELARLHRHLGATMLYVTHDQEEALTLGDRIAVLREGQLQQVAPPLVLYQQPANMFVAGFIGAPAMNFFPCTLVQQGSVFALQSPTFTIPVPETYSLAALERDLILGIRPHDVALSAETAADLHARVELIERHGSHMVVHTRPETNTGQDSLLVVLPPGTQVSLNDRLGLHFPRDRLHLFAAGSGKRIAGMKT